MPRAASQESRDGLGGTIRATPRRWVVVSVFLLLVVLVALPAYRTRADMVRVSEATARIGLIVTGARAYAQQNQDPQGDPHWPPVRGAGLADLSSTRNFDFWIKSGGGANARTTPLTIVAVGRSGSEAEGLTVSVTIPNVAEAGSAAVVERS